MTRGAIALLAALAAAGCNFGAAGIDASGSEGFKPVATVDQVMGAIVIPSSQAIFDAVVYDNGVLVQAPKTDDDWFRLQMQALAVAEAGNLLLMPTRHRREADWTTFSHALTDRAVSVAQAAEAKDVDRLLATGGDLYRTCTTCHAKYLPME